jgi:hypothetical protein
MFLSTAYISVAVIGILRLRRRTKWCKTPCIPPLGQNCEYLLIIMCRARRIEYAQFRRSRWRKVKANGIDAQSIPSTRWRARHDTSTTPRCQTRLTVVHRFLRARKTRRHRARALSYATSRRQELSRKQKLLVAGPTHGSDNPCPLAPNRKNLIKPIRAGAFRAWQGVPDQIAP